MFFLETEIIIFGVSAETAGIEILSVKIFIQLSTYKDLTNWVNYLKIKHKKKISLSQWGKQFREEFCSLLYMGIHKVEKYSFVTVIFIKKYRFYYKLHTN